MSEVEIIWPSTMDRSRLDEVLDLLESDGVETTCRIQPVRRGPQTTVLLLLTTTALQPFLKAVFQQAGSDAFATLKEFLKALFTGGFDQPDPEPATVGAEAVVFESSTTGARFVFTPSLPDEAITKALALDPGEDPGQWMWDGGQREWLKVQGVGR